MHIELTQKFVAEVPRPIITQFSGIFLIGKLIFDGYFGA